METSFPKNKALSSLLFVLYLVFLTSLVCNFRAITSICIGGIFFAGIVKNKAEHTAFISKKCFSLFSIACFAYYGLQWIAVFYTHDRETAWKDIQLKSALLFIPLAVCCTDYLNKIILKKLLDYLILLLAAACFYCFVIACLNFFHYHHTGVFFYHALVKPLSQHAVYFSILVFIALAFLTESAGNREFLFHKAFHWFLIIYFSFFIFLLSSKLVICFYLAFLFYYIIIWLRSQKISRVAVTVLLIAAIGSGTLLITTRNPVNSRFTELVKGDLSLFEKQKYNPGIYFNDIQFRLVEWKFVNQILDEQHAWMFGVSPGDAQSLLNQKYISSGMYVGDPKRGDHGFLNYNTHNELLESLLKTGTIGALLFLFICLAMIRIAWQAKNRLAGFIILLLLIFSFNESVFETQYGLVFFIFFPLFFSRVNRVVQESGPEFKQPIAG